MELKIKIVSDSSCDISAAANTDISIAPLTISADGRDYIDNESTNIHEMLDNLARYNGRSFSACPNVEMWLNSFGDADIIYCIAMTSGLSGTYNSACAARDLYMQKNPEAKVFVLDTLSTGPEQRLIVEKAKELSVSGLEFEDVCQELENYKNKTRLFFSLASLHNFAQNGRVSKLVASAVGMLSMRIVGTASREGTLEMVSKCRGELKAKSALLELFKEAGYNGGRINLCHVENEKFAQEIKAEILTSYPDADVSVYPAGALCSYYAERGGLLVGIEC